MHNHSRATRSCQPGFTLLEIILALALLAGALAALGEVLRQARRSAELARDATEAQLLAASVLAELVSQVRPLEVVDRSTLDPEVDPPWLYSILLENTPHTGIVQVRVRVEQQLPPERRPTAFELVRWLRDPASVPVGAAGGG